jgi:DNA-nicking Smr family endonuclease
LSHKIKLSIKDTTKNLEELPNQKISISLGKKNKKNSIASPNDATTKITYASTLPKAVSYDQQLFKQFKNSTYSKIDLHGHTVDEAHQVLTQYVKKNFNQKKLLHIVITGLGNKSSDGEFFTGKIRKKFPLWLETEIFQKYIKSYSPCKIQHGGLGAFYIKLNIKE